MVFYHGEVSAKVS